MTTLDANTRLKITAHASLSQDQLHALSLLYLPVIGSEAYSLYMALYSLTDRSRLKSPTYPHAFLFDMLNMPQQTYLKARQTLEASGLLETFKGKEEYYMELFLPLSPESFIKDSPFGPYLKHEIGEERFEDLIAHFKITRTQKKRYEAVSVSFDEVFPPMRNPVKTKAAYVQARSKKTEVKHATDIDLVLEAIPDTLLAASCRTKRFKEKLREMAYVYQLGEESLRDLIRQSLTKEKSVDFTRFRTLAQKEYQHQSPRRIQKKADAYSLDYFKSVHPKTMLEETTGMKVPAADLKVVETLITESGLPLEVLNVLIAYVLKELDNQFPVYNYFEKIVAEWKRANIETADDAIAHIEKKIQKRKQAKQAKPYKKRGREKPVDTDIDWFKDYLKDREE